MKKLLSALFISFAVFGIVRAQKEAVIPSPSPARTPVKPPPKPGTVQAEKISAVIEREKFDPKRDSAADLKTAVSKASAEHKRIVLDIGGEWCVWCRYMDRFLLTHTELEKLKDDNFVWLKIDYSEGHENSEFLSAYPAASGYPHFYILDEDGKLLLSQSTDILETPDGYSVQKFADFLKKWAPPARTGSIATPK
jgi:thioredoxin-related protein